MRFRLLLLLVGVFLWFSEPATADKVTSEAERVAKTRKTNGQIDLSDKAMSKAERLAKMRKSNGLIDLSETSYETYALKNTPFHVVILFVARDPKYGCQVCGLMEKQLSDLAQSHAYLTDGDGRDIFFGVCDVEQCREVFRTQEFRYVPHMVAVKAGAAYNKAPYNGRLPDDAFMAQGNYPGFDSQAMADFIKDQTGVTIFLMGKLQEKLAYCAAVALLAAVLVHLLRRLPQFYLHRYLWRAISLSLFFVCVSGFVYCLIQKVPLTRVGQDKSVINPQGRDQWVLEGVAIAMLYVGMLLSAVTLVKVSQRGAWGKAWVLLRPLLATLALALFCVLLHKYFSIYVLKTRWYQLANTLPSGVAAYLKTPVYSSSPLPRRLLRLANVFLNEFTTWDAFFDKADKLLGFVSLGGK